MVVCGRNSYLTWILSIYGSRVILGDSCRSRRYLSALLQEMAWCRIYANPCLEIMLPYCSQHTVHLLGLDQNICLPKLLWMEKRFRNWLKSEIHLLLCQNAICIRDSYTILNLTHSALILSQHNSPHRNDMSFSWLKISSILRQSVFQNMR